MFSCLFDLTYSAKSCAVKWHRAKKGLAEAEKAFTGLDETISEDLKKKWKEEEDNARIEKGKRLASLYEPRIRGEKGAQLELNCDCTLNADVCA